MITYESILLIMYVLIFVFVFFAYRTFCLKVSLKYEDKVIKYLEKLYDDPNVDDEVKKFAHWEYRNFLSFHFWLLVPIVIPFLMFFSNRAKIREKRESLELTTKEFREFLFNLYRAVFTRRPILVITSAILSVILLCLTGIFVIIVSGVMAFFFRKSKLLFNRFFFQTPRNLSVFMYNKNNS